MGKNQRGSSRERLRTLFRIAGTAGIATFGLGILQPPNAWARPEYATRMKMNCMSCHASPWGGGPRNVFGKTFGSHGYPPAKTSTNDVYYGDVRFIEYLPTKKTTSVNGLALMEAAVTGNVALMQNEEEHSELRAVLTYNISPISVQNASQVREAYLRWQLPADPGHIPTHLIFGRFYVPFGLLTDEHRTYTRLQTNTPINNYFNGGAASWNFNEDWHWDFALVNDLQTGNSFNQNNLTFGTVLNTRWNPKQLPFLLGASGMYEKTTRPYPPFATSLYGVLSFDRLTHDKVSANLNLEWVSAKNWNNPVYNTGQINTPLPGFFIPSTDQAYQGSILSTRSNGYQVLAKYFLSHAWAPFYKFDYLDLNVSSDHNSFLRHGFGVEAYLNSNLILNVRYELAHVNRPEISSSNVLAAQSDVFAMIRFWL